MAQFGYNASVPEIDTVSMQKIPGAANAPASPQGTMQDVELSSRKVPVDGVFGWIKPWFCLTDREFADRCKSCTFSYLCLDLTCTRVLNVYMSEARLRFGHFLSKLGVPTLFAEESLDVSTASLGANNIYRGENSASTFSFASRANPSGSTDSQMSGSPEGTMEEAALGVLQDYCNKSHPSFVTLRRMWTTPDLYSFFWINVLFGGYLFLLYSLSKHLSGKLEDVVGLSILAKFITLCLLCSVSMSGAISACRSVICGKVDTNAFVPVLCLSGYLQIPLLLLAHMSVWSSILVNYMPVLSVLLWLVQIVTFFYLCVSTISAVLLYIPAVPDNAQDLKLKFSNALAACATQVMYFTWIYTCM